MIEDELKIIRVNMRGESGYRIGQTRIDCPVGRNGREQKRTEENRREWNRREENVNMLCIIVP